MSLIRFFKKTAFYLVVIILSGKVYSQDLNILNIGSIPSGKTLVIKYAVKIDNPLPEGVTQISNQGTISGSNFSNVLTDDANTMAAFDATVTDVILNAPPTIAGVLANQAVNDNATIAPFASVSIADSDLPAQTLTVTISLDAAAKGSFTTLNGFTNESEGVYNFIGTVAAVNTAISGLIFTPAANRVAPESTETTTFAIAVNDGNGGNTSTSGTSVTVTSVNDIPVLARGTASQPVNDNATVAPFTDITIADPDPQNLRAQVVITNGINRGDFTTGSATGWTRTVNGNDIAYTRPFNAAGNNSAAAQMALRALVFQPRTNSIVSELTESTTFSISVDDGSGPVSNASIISTITTSVNDAPIIASNEGGPTASIALAENTIAVTTVLANDADITPSITYSLNGGSDAAKFLINASTGSLSFNMAPDFEVPTDADGNNTYQVIVRASDGMASDDQTLTITITDLNDVVPIIAGNHSFSIDENAANGTLVGTVMATDGDITPTTFKDWAITSGNTNNAFAINSTTGGITVNASAELDREITGSYILTLTVGDGMNTSAPQAVGITIRDVNDVAPVIAAGQSFSIDENSANGSIVGTVTATDGDVTPPAAWNWIITSGNTNDAFAISGTTGAITVNKTTELNHEVTGSYTMTLTVGDGTNTSAPQTVSITINDLNDVAPVIAAGQSFNINENAANGTVVGTLTATDGDVTVTPLQSWTITSGNTNNAFAINSTTGVISVNKSTELDREVSGNYALTLTVGDGANTSASQTVSITINDLNDVAPLIAAGQSFNIDENSANGTVVGTVTATDGDNTATTFKDWTITSGNTNNAFAINSTTGVLTVNNSTELDREVTGSYTLTLTAGDGVNTSAAQTVGITINDINDVVPVITANQVFSINENAVKGKVVGTVTATDGDISATTYLNWTITSGNTNNAFVVNDKTGAITVSNSLALNSELKGSYILTITVGDVVNTSLAERVSITINDLNDVVPVITPNQRFRINENVPAGTSVGVVVATDGDITPTTFQNWKIMLGNTSNAFAINAATGMISVNAAVLDFETKSSYDLTLHVSDGVHVSASCTVSIDINDQREAPTNISLAQTVLYENQLSGSLAGKLSSTSDDPDASFTYRLVVGAGDSDNNLFRIQNNEIRTSKILNYEQKANYQVRVRSTTQYGFHLDRELIISLKDINEIPTLDAISDQVLCYTSAQQKVALTGVSAGEDVGQVVLLKASNTNQELFTHFTVEGSEIRYKIKEDASGTALVTVTVTDNGGTANGGTDSYSRSFNVRVNPLPVAAISSDKGTDLAKGLVANLTASGGVTYQWSNAHGILGGQNTATLTVRPARTTIYSVRVTNGSGCTSEQEITLRVSDNYSVMEANNILTPNGDGVNDQFKIDNIDMYPNNEVKIYDRAGRLLYSKKNYSNDWDGTLRGDPLAEDTYFYIVDFGPGVSPIKGFITIVKD